MASREYDRAHAMESEQCDGGEATVCLYSADKGKLRDAILNAMQCSWTALPWLSLLASVSGTGLPQIAHTNRDSAVGIAKPHE
jgi:hypothetical protein